MSRFPTRSELEALASEEGFDAAGVAPAAPSSRAEAMRRWVAEGRHADMEWWARSLPARLNPGAAYPGTKSWLVVGASYVTSEPPPGLWLDPRRGRIARYAWGPDYHDVLRARAAALAERLRRLAALSVPPPVAVDTAPVPERELAERAGLGFIGHNTMLIRPGLGSWVHLAVLALPWEPHGGDEDRQAVAGGGCSECRRCMERCPTRALAHGPVLDARRCVAWMTVECRGDWPGDPAAGSGRWLVGCDECQECCPWNRPAMVRPSRRPWLRFEPELHTPPLDAAIFLNPAEFRQRYAGTVVGRIGWRRWIRNALAAAAHASEDPALCAAVRRHAEGGDEFLRREAARCFEQWRTAAERQPRAPANPPTPADGLRRRTRR